MKKVILSLLFILLGLSAMADEAADYTIGAGDVLYISVWKDEALTTQAVVLPDGRINFPLIGQVQAEGLSLTQFKQGLAKKLKRYVPDPELTVMVQQVNSNAISIVGEVNRPGRYNLNGQTSVLQALALAGGLNPYAKKNFIRILRKEGDETVTYRFKFSQIARGKQLEQNITLQRGDVIIVP